MADKLEERLRATERLRRDIGMGVTVPDGCKLRNPDGPEAADEITRLNAENERLTKEADDLGEQANRWRNAWGESQTLVDEMREGLEEIKELADTAPNCTEVQMIWESARDLITKASRDSGHETRT